MGARENRLDLLVRELEQHGPMSVEHLGGVLRASPATIRRDLAELARARRIVRTRGGARVYRSDEEAPIPVRDTIARDAKLRIARATADLIPAGPRAIAVGGGTTTAGVLEAIGNRPGLTVVTNSLTIAALAGRLRIARIIVVGGYVRHESQELVGSFAEHTLGAVRVAYAILGTGGLTAAGGITTHDEAEARTNNAMIATAQHSIVVADHSKFGRLALSPLATAEEIDTLVTDAAAPSTELDAFRAAGVQVVIAPDDASSPQNPATSPATASRGPAL